MKENQFVIGVDFGTDSVRTVVLNAANGDEIACSAAEYSRWRTGMYCDSSKNQFRQHPLDYMESLETAVIECLSKAGTDVAEQIKAISVATTGSTPVAVDASGTPLALLPGFEENPNAMFLLWKDHSAVLEASEINRQAEMIRPDYLRFVGGIYSSEWFWAKLLHILRTDEKIRNACYSWVEHCDWIPFLLTGGTRASDMKRSRCAAGHKALWAGEHGGLPPDSFFTAIDPLLAGLRARLFEQTYTADRPAGFISAYWAQRLGLPKDVIIGIGAFDAHMGAVGGQIEPYYLSKVMGTSTCDMMVMPIQAGANLEVKGICGQVPGSIIPGMLGMEAGQSAFGDAYAWFRELVCWPVKHLLAETNLVSPEVAKHLKAEIESKVLRKLSEQAEQLELDEDMELAVDWLNGRRTPDANQLLKGAMLQLDLGSDAIRLFRSLAEATCFGAKSIVDRFGGEGVPVKGIIGMGGVARKSPFIMQMMADVLNMPIRIHRSAETCAAGAAMFAATAAGIYEKVEDAMNAMGQGFETVYHPDIGKVSFYSRRYLKYREACTFIEQSISTQSNVSTS